jgi:hypothetical protein
MATAPLFAGPITPVVTISTVADTATLIPAGGGTFIAFNPGLTSLPPSPCVSNGNVTFWGAGVGQQGIYATLFGKLTKVADLNTTIPGSTQTFLNIPPSPWISGGNVAFIGNGDGAQGIYVGYPPSPIYPPNPFRIADLNTPIPGGTGNFTGYLPGSVISGNNLVFVGNGANGQQGVYASFVSNPFYPPGPVRIADQNTAIPLGTGNFVSYPPSPWISGNNIAFIGTGANGQQGVYRLFPPNPFIPIADSNTPVPGGSGNFNHFFNIALDDTNLAYVGGVLSPLGENNFILTQQGVYVFQLTAPQTKIADFKTLVPGGNTNFACFGNLAIDPSHVVFEALSIPDGVTIVQGLYTNLTGTLTKLIDTRDTINGKQLTAINFGSGGFSGNQVVFEAEFSDGSQSIALATVSANRCPQSQGFWKNSPALWPENSLILGNQSYSQSELLTILNTSPTSDASLVLARQLIAAKLNIGNFSDPDPVSGTISEADGLLAGFAGKLPYNAKTSSSVGQAMVNDANLLEKYTSDLLTAGCTP